MSRLHVHTSCPYLLHIVHAVSNFCHLVVKHRDAAADVVSVDFHIIYVVTNLTDSQIDIIHIKEEGVQEPSSELVFDISPRPGPTYLTQALIHLCLALDHLLLLGPYGPELHQQLVLLLPDLIPYPREALSDCLLELLHRVLAHVQKVKQAQAPDPEKADRGRGGPCNSVIKEDQKVHGCMRAVA